MSRSIACPYCVKGQCYFQSDGDGGIELKCLQCSRLHPRRLNLPEAESFGMKRGDYYKLIFSDWSQFGWDDGDPVVDLLPVEEESSVA